jgi:predicted RNase H-like HicB family nuclease
MADGNTYAAALKNVEKIARMWIQTAKSLGREVPKPRGRLKYA